MDGGEISNDGRYVLYTTFIPIDHSATASMLVLQAGDDQWSRELPGASNAIFTSDSKWVVVSLEGSRLGLLELGGTALQQLGEVTSFKVAKNPLGDWLAYELRAADKGLVVRNLRTGESRILPGVTQYEFDPAGEALWVQTLRGAQPGVALSEVRLSDGHRSAIWQGESIVEMRFNAQRGMAFISGGESQPGGRSLWYYRTGARIANLLVHPQGVDSGQEFGISSIRGFSRHGESLQFDVEATPAAPVGARRGVGVDVWSYSEKTLHSAQLVIEQHLKAQKVSAAPARETLTVNIRSGAITRLTGADERIMDKRGDRYLTLRTDESRIPDTVSSVAGERRDNVFVVSVTDGRRWPVPGVGHLPYWFSPSGRFVVYYDPSQRSYLSYDLSTGLRYDITKGLGQSWTLLEDRLITAEGVEGVFGWLKNDAGVLIGDQEDLWQVDLRGTRPALNLTHGYGKRTSTILRPAMPAPDEGYAVGQEIILTALSRDNKDNGFFNMRIGAAEDPRKLTMGPYAYRVRGDYSNFGAEPIKARAAEVYLVRRMSASEAPNYFLTRDFVRYTAVSHVHPETQVNWLTSELVTWRSPGGQITHGILYKPANFDLAKKYPLIFRYYEMQSDYLREFPELVPPAGEMNIPLMVSNDYLVFAPDIHFRDGMPGASALESIVSAANVLGRLPYVDAQHLGIYGYSLGGYETNYIITHSGAFAAAVSACGPSDLVSLYGGLWSDGKDRHDFYKNGQVRISPTLWQRPDLYIENSPVFKADAITTPLLMMNNAADGNVPFAQGVELFTAMRSLGKKVWMLQYDNSDHLLSNGDSIDFEIRTKQFFDHYLKGMPPPRWLTQGVPAQLKGVQDGLQFDTSGRDP